MVISGGGPVFNVGKTLSKIMDHSKYNLILVGKTGEDPFSKLLEETAKVNGLQLSLKKERILKTGYTLAITNKHIDRCYLHYTWANDNFSSNDVNFPNKNSPWIFHFGYPQLMKKMVQENGELVKLFSNAKKEGYITSMDMSLVSENSEAAQKKLEEVTSWGTSINKHSFHRNRRSTHYL